MLIRKAKNDILVVLNISNNNYTYCDLNIKGKKIWRELYNSNAIKYWGTGDFMNPEPILTNKKSGDYVINIALPALSILIFQ